MSSKSESLAKTRDRRCNAGNRMARLLNDEEDAKDTFYSTTYGGFEEAEDDNDYRSESSEEDEVDSDFDIDEEDNEEEERDDDDEKGRRGGRARSRVVTKAYKEPVRPKRSQATKKSPEKPRRPRKETEEAEADPEPVVVSIDKKSLRRTTAAKSQALKAREVQRQSRKELMKSIAQRKNVPEVRRLTQEELLAEAKITEEINLRSLAQYQRLEIEKKRAKAAKVIQKRPTINFYSIAVPIIDLAPEKRAEEAVEEKTDSAATEGEVKPSNVNDKAAGAEPEKEVPAGATAKVVEVDMAQNTWKEKALLLDPSARCSRNFVTFTDVGDFRVTFPHAGVSNTRLARPRIRDQMCPITGERARYIDPLTRTPFANKTAFRVLRHLYSMHVKSGEKAIDLLRKYRHGEIQVMQNARLLTRTLICPICHLKRQYTGEATKLHSVYKAELKKRSRTSTSNQDLALHHFDTFYGQIYGESWPSIRAALLSPRKYVAVVNRFADEAATIKHLRHIGRRDIIPEIAEASREYLVQQEAVAPNRNFTSYESSPEFEGAIEEAVIRQRKTLLSSMSANLSESGRTNVNEFIPVTEIISEHDVGYRVDVHEKNPTEVLQQEEEVSEFAGPIPTVHESPEDFSLPTGLKVFALARGEVHSMGKPRYNPYGQSQFLPLNGASILPILALNLNKDDTVLDLCAAPGGKTTMMVQTLLPSQILCVDSSSGRLDRLRMVLTSMGPPNMFESGLVSIEHCDGRVLHPGMEFDKVIVDVPCTGDRYALTSPDQNIFSSRRANERRRLPERQTSLLLRSLKLCRPGGEVVYSTCTLSTAQNESVVRTALNKLAESTQGKTRFAHVDLNHIRHALDGRFFKFDDAPRMGLTALPFLPNNYGPAYVCKLRRIE